MTIRPVLLPAIVVATLLIPLQALAIPITHDFSWVGANDYSLMGRLTGSDVNADGLIRDRDDEVTSLYFEAFREGRSIGFGYSDPSAASADPFLNLNFDIAARAFTQGEGLGPLGQQWNVKGPGIGFSQGGSGAILRVDGKNDFATFTLYRDVPGSGFARVPEPASLALLAAGLLGFAGVRRSRSRSTAMVDRRS